MLLLTINFGFHVIAVFLFYKKFANDSLYYFTNVKVYVDDISVAISVIWHFYYASVSLLVIISGALLSKHVSYLSHIESTNSQILCICVTLSGTKNRSICSQTIKQGE